MYKYTPFIFFIILLLKLSSYSFAQEVPNWVEIGKLRVYIRTDAKEQIKKTITMLKKSPRFYQTLITKADAHLPIVEKILAEEEVPDEIKFLPILESSLIGDAVSTSNAVGYWQFKKESAQELGLRIDNTVDDRKHIVFSTMAASRYFKKNQSVFKNWAYTIISYNTGLTGAKPFISDNYIGVNEMEVTSSTHVYLLKFIAFMITFKDDIKKNLNPEYTLFEYGDTQKRTISEIASEVGIPEDEIRLHNKWLLANNIPEDKLYPVMLPLKDEDRIFLLAKLKDKGISHHYDSQTQTKLLEPVVADKFFVNLSSRSQSVSGIPSDIPVIIVSNGLKAIKSKAGDDFNLLAIQGKIKPKHFLKYNDLQAFEQIIPDEIYYLEAKRDEGTVLFHTVTSGQDLWEIAQMYGIRVRALIRKNRMRPGEALALGRILNLKKTRKREEPVIFDLDYTSKQQSPVQNEVFKPISKLNYPTQQVNEPAQETIVVKNETIVPKQEPTFINKPEIEIIENKEVIKTEQEKPIKIDTSAAKPIDTPTYSSRYLLTKPEEKYTYQEKLFIKPDTNIYKVYKVEPSQTLFSVSRMFNQIPIDSIKKWNGFQQNSLAVGQWLIVGMKKTEPKLMPTSMLKHIVKEDQTLFNIARMYNYSVDSIKVWNQMRDYKIKLGQELWIKKSGEEQRDFTPLEMKSESYIFHEVGQGEGLYKISKLYNVSIEQIKVLNNKSTDYVSIGEKLKIKLKE